MTASLTPTPSNVLQSCVFSSENISHQALLWNGTSLKAQKMPRNEKARAFIAFNSLTPTQVLPKSELASAKLRLKEGGEGVKSQHA